METLIQCPTSYECSEYHIPDGVKTIRSNSFYGCTGIDKIECPDSVITIESNAFKMFTSLGEISLSRNLKKIGSYAFENCRNLYEITIPESVEEIGYNAFFYADLYEITIENPDVELPSGFLINHRETIDGKTVYSYTGVINGKEHSTAQKYAEDNNIKFNSLGTFTYNYGDVTGDGIIDATDASFILTAYAKSSINEDDGMTAQQRKCADVNKDGVVDAVDASTVLTFYALSSTGNKQTFDEFVMSLSNL